jgi:hypothetical protein
MTRVYSLDGRVFEVADDRLAAAQLADERVAALLGGGEPELPDAPPPGELPQIAREWPVPDELRGFVRLRSIGNSLVIDIDVRPGQGPRGRGDGPARP